MQRNFVVFVQAVPKEPAVDRISCAWIPSLVLCSLLYNPIGSTVLRINLCRTLTYVMSKRFDLSLWLKSCIAIVAGFAGSSKAFFRKDSGRKRLCFSSMTVASTSTNSSSARRCSESHDKVISKQDQLSWHEDDTILQRRPCLGRKDNGMSRRRATWTGKLRPSLCTAQGYELCMEK